MKFQQLVKLIGEYTFNNKLHIPIIIAIGK